MIACPECGSLAYVRYEDPKEAGNWLIRRKRCTTCRHIFATGEIVLAGKAADVFEMLMRSSEPTLEGVDTSDLEALEWSPTTATTDSSLPTAAQ